MDAEKRRLMEENRRLRARVEELEQMVRALQQQVRVLQEQVQVLTAALEEARRAGKRQAAPFRKPKRVEKPKKPGRKPGKQYGEHARRIAPKDAPIDEKHDAPLPPECPTCGSRRLQEIEPTAEQFQTEIVCRTMRRRFAIHRGHCRDCGTAVSGRHPLQTSTATGAAGEQLGPKAHALMSVLNKRLGLSHGKVSWMFEKVFGLKIDRSTSARSCVRTARRCAAAYQQIRDDLRAAEEVTPDETGWRVGGGKAWLHAFATARTACYEIDPTRSGDVAERLLGLDWNGRLVHDGWSVYDRFAQAIHQQCNAHLLNRCKELLEVARRGAARFPLAVKGLLQQGLAVRDRFAEGEISPHGLLVSAGRLTARLERVVDGRFTHDGNRRLANFLSKHLCEVFAYLRHPGMAATNYRGEQSIRPAVVNRKVWGGNRTWLGAWAQSVLMSVIGTSLLRRIDPLNFFIEALTSPNPVLLAQPPP
jgi:transposase